MITQYKNPWASPAERRKSKEDLGIMGWDWGTKPEMQEVKTWFDDLGFNRKRRRRSQ